MRKRNFYVLLLIVSVVIISAAATYSLQMFDYYDNNETDRFSVSYNFSPGDRFDSWPGISDFWQAVQTHVGQRLKPSQDPASNDSGGNYSDVAEIIFETDNSIVTNLPWGQNQDYILLDSELMPADNGQIKGEQLKKDREIAETDLKEAVDEDAIGVEADSQFVDRIKSQLQQYPEHFFIRSFNAQRKVALTFDDGPGPHTEKILDILAENDVQATFFVVGFQVENFPGVLSRIIEEGHLVGNHSYSHSDFSELTLAEVRREIEHTNQLIRKEAGHEPVLIRPPYGRITNQQLEKFIEEGYKFINWSVDSLDWDEKDNHHDLMLTRINNSLHPGAIILLHDAGGDRSETEKLLPELIESLKSRGYEFVTVKELLFQ